MKVLSLSFLSLVLLTSVTGLCPAEDPVTYETETNIIYREDSQDLDEYLRSQCRLDLYYPKGVKDFATVVWFHGGGLTGGKRFLPEQLKGQQIAIATVSYRLSPKVKVVDCIDDAAAATAWVFENIERFGGSRKRIFVSGHSAGGYLTCMIGLDRHWLTAYGIEANDIAGLVPFSTQAITHFTARSEQQIPPTQPIIDELAPLSHVRGDAPPILILTGDREMEYLGRYEENAYFWRMFKIAKHPDVTLLEFPGYGHGNMPEPGYPHLLKFVKRVSK